MKEAQTLYDDGYSYTDAMDEMCQQFADLPPSAVLEILNEVYEFGSSSIYIDHYTEAWDGYYKGLTFEENLNHLIEVFEYTNNADIQDLVVELEGFYDEDSPRTVIRKI